MLCCYGMCVCVVCCVCVFASFFLYRCQVCCRKGVVSRVVVCSSSFFVFLCFSDFFVLSKFSRECTFMQDYAIVEKKKYPSTHQAKDIVC